MSELLLIATEDIVVFPNMTVTLPVAENAIGVEDKYVLLVPTRKNEYASVGTVAEVLDRVKLPHGNDFAITVAGLHRGIAGTARTDIDGRLRVAYTEHRDVEPDGTTIRELEREYRAVVSELLEMRGADARIADFVRSIAEAGHLADTSGYAPDITYEQKVQLLETLDVGERLSIALGLQRERLTEMQIRRRIRDDIETGAQKQQREYILRRQLDSIRKELGEDEASVVDEYRKQIEELDMPDTIREQALRELSRLERIGDEGGESSTIRTYLDWLVAMPWGKYSDDQLDPAHARTVLDDDHAGLEDVKDRIIEALSVRKLRMDRGIEDEAASGAILTLIGPPGTGKTSIGESIARSMGREFVRMSLGGIRDEAEIRGHRRTYIGALPGRLVRALRDAKTMNPVILLDEVDKVGADWRGDPSSALLEVLDPAQNSTFRDHYLDVEVDLSQVFFIATANLRDGIPQPLLDRMEVIDFDGYTVDEKVAIAQGYLWPRQLQRNGLKSDEVSINEMVIRTIVSDYTREAGVRQLERVLGTILRKTATTIVTEVENTTRPFVIDIESVQDSLGRQKYWHEAADRTAIPGVATGLAVTGTGGEVLFVEATTMPGSEGLRLTGQLGEVMKESTHIALSHIRANAATLQIDESVFKEHAFHVHVPAGAIPKDGPSAGITMATALASLLSGRAVKHTVGMTGEVTLQGRVLPIGGLKQKAIAAYAAGLKDVIIPERNRADLEDVPEDVRKAVKFHPVMTLTEVFDIALEPALEPSTSEHAVPA